MHQSTRKYFLFRLHTNHTLPLPPWVSLWDGTNPASLSLGRPTYQGSALRLDLIESSSFNPDELQVFPITLIAMTTYAEMLGAGELRVMNPINDGVKCYYQTYGLVYVAKGDYLYVKL